MDIANTIDEAMASLQKSTETEIIDDEEMSEEEHLSIDITKAEDTDDDEVAELIKADDFMQHLANNQTENTDRLVKGLEGNLNATSTIFELLKGMSEQITTLSETVEQLSGVPQNRRSALTKAEAQDAVTPSGNDIQPSQVLTKGEVLTALSSAYTEGTISGDDVIKAESAFAGGPVVMSNLLRSLSSKGKVVVQTLQNSKTQ